MLAFVFCFRQKTAYEVRISDWSSDVCSSDLVDADADDALLGNSSVPGQRHRSHDQQPKPTDDAAASEIDISGYKPTDPMRWDLREQIGRASCRERVCQYVSISVVAVSLKQNKDQLYDTPDRNRTRDTE